MQVCEYCYHLNVIFIWPFSFPNAASLHSFIKKYVLIMFIILIIFIFSYLIMHGWMDGKGYKINISYCSFSEKRSIIF